MKGRKPKPNVIHIATGSKNVRKNEPKPTTPLGKPPSILEGRALEEWHTLAAELNEIGIGTKIEATSLACYCLAVQQLEDAREEVKRLGLVVMTERGFVKNPATTIMNSAMTQIRQFAMEFGLTPVSRARVKTAPKPTESKWAALKKKA